MLCRQLLFEQRLVGAWFGVDRIRLARALEAWRNFHCLAPNDTAHVEAERQRWREEVERERAASLERSRLAARQLEWTKARLDAAEAVVSQYREDNKQLQAELAAAQREARGGGGDGGDSPLRDRTQRAASGTRGVLQEAALRSRLEAEQRRLGDSSSQLASLEIVAEADQAALRLRQLDEEGRASARRDAAAASFREERQRGWCGRAEGGMTARTAWRAAYTHARLQLTWQRHERELTELEERLEMLHALRESRDALDWRVTQTKAALIVMRSNAPESHAQAVDEAFGMGGGGSSSTPAPDGQPQLTWQPSQQQQHSVDLDDDGFESGKENDASTAGIGAVS